jgi:hypothetical protein
VIAGIDATSSKATRRILTPWMYSDADDAGA